MDPNSCNRTILLITGILVLSIFSLRDSYSQDSEISQDQTTFTVSENQTVQLIIPLSNSTKDLNRYSIFVDASSTLDDIDVFGTIDSLRKENNQITLNLTDAR